MEEIWKDIKGYEGIYQVSNWGRVKSLARKNSRGRQLNKRMLKPSINGVGYAQCGLYLNGNRKMFQVHQLVAITFLGHIPDGHKIVVDHKNNYPLDNRADNLQLISHRENLSKDKKGYSSKYVGVDWHKATSKWRAHIRINGKLKHLGYFIDELAAAQAYQNELKALR